jgi:hypothetical protein
LIQTIPVNTVLLFYANTFYRVERGLGPPKIKVPSYNLSPKVTNPESLYGAKIMKIRAIENCRLRSQDREKRLSDKKRKKCETI